MVIFRPKITQCIRFESILWIHVTPWNNLNTDAIHTQHSPVEKILFFFLFLPPPPFFSSSSPLLLSGTSADLTQAPKIDPEEQLFKEHMFELTSQVNKTNRFVGFFDFRPHLLSPSKRVFLPLLPGPLSPSSHLATCLCRRRCRFGGAALQCTYRSLNQQH